MKHDEGKIDASRRDYCLKDADRYGSPSHYLQILQPEFISDCKCDEAEGCLAYYLKATDLGKAVEAHACDIESAEAERSDEKSCDEICGDCRKIHQLCGSGHQKPGDQCERQ